MNEPKINHNVLEHNIFCLMGNPLPPSTLPKDAPAESTGVKVDISERPVFEAAASSDSICPYQFFNSMQQQL